MFKKCVVTAVALLGMNQASASVDQKTSAFVLCKNKKEVRTIRILPDGAKSENCLITYSKNGIEEVVGSNRAMTTCQSIASRLQNTLESSKWSCRNVQTAKVTIGTEVLSK